MFAIVLALRHSSTRIPCVVTSFPRKCLEIWLSLRVLGKRAKLNLLNSLKENREDEFPLIVPRNIGSDRLQIVSLRPNIRGTYTLQNILETHDLNVQESGGTCRDLCSRMYTTC
jgi:hypothetical protein